MLMVELVRGESLLESIAGQSDIDLNEASGEAGV
jgi:hypothetical protein